MRIRELLAVESIDLNAKAANKKKPSITQWI